MGVSREEESVTDLSAGNISSPAQSKAALFSRTQRRRIDQLCRMGLTCCTDTPRQALEDH